MAENTSSEMGNLSLQTKNRFLKDLLHRFTASSTSSGDPRESNQDEEVELNLGLSLGGIFGVDKSKLVRASSIASILPVVKDDDCLDGSCGKSGHDRPYSSLIRTSSLPVETEEEWRKRKGLQSLRRLAAKRRRSEKQKNLTKFEREEYVVAMGRVGSSVEQRLGSGNWDFVGRATATVATSDGSGGGSTPPSLPGLVESEASCISEVESRHLQGSRIEGEATPASVQSGQDLNNQDTITSKVMNPRTRPSIPKSENPSNHKGKEIRSNTIDMPCVFTQGDSPSGRRIEGILYKYGKGEEVKIMCVCHGSFLSPAEFVKHAGGADVIHPLKHIVVSPNSYL